MKKLTIFCLLLIALAPSIRAQDSLKYSKKQVAADIYSFMTNAADIHPNLYHDISKQQLTYKIDSLIKTLPDSLSELRTYRTFAEATAFINEGHTGVNIPKAIRAQRKAGAFKSIPLQVIDYNEGYFLANVTTRGSNLKAIKVITINGQTAASLFKQMTALRGGLPSFRKISAITNFRFYLTAIGITQPYVINYLDQDNNKRELKVNSITENDYLAAIAKVENVKSYTFNVINNSFGYMNFRSMDNYSGFAKFCDSVFQLIDQQHVNKLVIDLRENGGGNSSLGRYLLNYITTQPYRMAGDGERKVSQGFKNYLEANKAVYGNNYDNLLKMQNGTFLKMGNEDLHKPEEMPHKYQGKVCFLIGPNTFSSANMLAATVKDFKLSTLIGEPTGEPANDYGELCNVEFPQTGFLGFTSTTLWVRPNNDKTDNKPIYPDFMVKSSHSENDDVLKFAVDWLAK